MIVSQTVSLHRTPRGRAGQIGRARQLVGHGSDRDHPVAPGRLAVEESVRPGCINNERALTVRFAALNAP